MQAIETESYPKYYQQTQELFLYYAQKDIFKHAISEELGGLSTSFHELCKVHFEIGKETFNSGLILSLNAHVWGGITPLVRSGDEKQKVIWLLPALSGQSISGQAITEPEAGSDINGISTFAGFVENGFILNGKKRYVTNAPIADWLVVYAKTQAGLSAFIVSRQDEGAQFTNKHIVNGFKSAPIGEVILENCLIPKNRLIGSLGSGLILMQSALELERAFLFAGISGIMETQLNKVIHYASNRQIGNAQLVKLQTINHLISNMQIRRDTIKLWLSHCATLKDQNKRISLQSSQTKVYASEAFLQSSLDAVHIMGALGLEPSTGMSDLITDAAASQLLSGTNEIQKNIISSLIGAY